MAEKQSERLCGLRNTPTICCKTGNPAVFRAAGSFLLRDGQEDVERKIKNTKYMKKDYHFPKNCV
jgi:hypothetical protein